MAKKGYLILENGQIIEGISAGWEKDTDGEVVFNTGMVGYPEGFTDPSYYGQILTMTYPLIGNYGVPGNKPNKSIISNWESDKIQIRGLIVSSLVDCKAHWQAERTLRQWFKDEKIPILEGIDTRHLTQILRESGVMKGKITIQLPPKNIGGLSFYDVNRDNLVARVSTGKISTYGSGPIKILVIDCGIKFNQLRIYLKYDTTLTITPWNYNPFDTNNKIKFDGIFITNGPGDPKTVKKTIAVVKQALIRKIPTLGICLGHQILALAAGADTYKLKYGHRGQNQPVTDESTGKNYISTQNHGYAVDKKTLPSGWLPWFTNLNDDTNEGIRHSKLPFLSCQFHPEANPGPTDTEWIFEYFLDRVKRWKR